MDQNRKGGARDLDSLDFTSMQHMINAAEPVDMAALLSFYEDFSPLGLRPGVIVPTFGLAEHCVYVCSCEPRYFLQPSASNKVRLHRSGVRFIACKKKTLESGVVECVSEDHASDSSVRTLVSCGDPSRANGVSVKIIDPVNFLIQKEGQVNSFIANILCILLILLLCMLQVGEIWINSGSKACGYWGHPEISLHEFHAVPADGKCSHGDDNVSIPTFAAQMISCEPSCSDISAIVDVSTRDTGYLRTGIGLNFYLK